MTRGNEPLRFRWLDQVRAGDSGVTRLGRHTAHELARFMDSDGRCFPSQERLAEAMATSARHVRDGLAELKREGFLDVARSRPNRYQALLKPEPGPGLKEGRASGLKEGPASGFDANRGGLPVQTGTMVPTKRQGTVKSKELESPDPVGRRAGEGNPNPYRDRLAELVYGTTELSTALKREVGVACAELRRQGVEPDELEPLVAAYRKRMNGAMCSASALAKWAPTLRASTGSPAAVRLDRAARLVELQAAELTGPALEEELARFRLAAVDVDKLLRRGAELRERTDDAA